MRKALPQHHCTSFHILLCLYPTNPLLIKTIHPSTQHPALPSPFAVSIPNSKESSITLDLLAVTTFRTHIYSNSSGLKGNVGSAAVWVKNSIAHHTLQLHLGKLTDHTVYKSELVGIILALEIVRKAGHTMPQPICISLDNQAAIRAQTLAAQHQGNTS